MTVGADASFSHQDAALLHAAGVKAIGRYAGPADSGKTITKAELDILLAHDVAVWLVHERAASQWRGGRPAGLQHGAETRAWARQTLGWPDDRPIYAPYDEAVGPADYPTFSGYQSGFNSGQNVSAAGAAYGDGYVLRRLTEDHLIEYKWLSDSTAFPESAAYARSGQASIVQYYGRTLPGLSGIDVDDILIADIGQLPAPSIVAPTPIQRRKALHYFFTIPDHPTESRKTVVFQCTGPEARALAEMTDYDQQCFIAWSLGYTKAQTAIGTLPWKYASRINGVS